MPLQQPPIEPVRLAIQAIGVVVATLAAADLVTHEQHRRADRHHQHRQEVLDLPAAQRLHVRRVGRPLRAAVPAQVVVRAVAVAFAVRLVVFVVVRDQIVERESVVAGDEVDALLRLPLLVTVEVRAAEQPRREAGHRAALTLPELSHVVAKPAVPLLPRVADEVADLVESRRVPCLGDQLGAGQHRIRFDVPQHGRVLQRGAGFVARQDRRQVEPEPVDMHLGHPVAQAVLDHAADDRLVGVERVAAAGEVRVSRLVGLQDVVEVVRQAAVTERRTGVAPLGGVIEHDVENHLDAGAMQRLDHVPELVERAERVAARAVGLVRRKEGHRLVSPIVGPSARRVEGIELKHWQQFHGRDVKILQVRDLLDHAGIRPPSA